MPQISQRVGRFTDSVIRRMTRISDEYGAINLSQGFPDFDPPRPMLDKLAEVAYAGPHQYSVTYGAENLRRALAEKHGVEDGRVRVRTDCGTVTVSPLFHGGFRLVAEAVSSEVAAELCDFVGESLRKDESGDGHPEGK